MRSYGMIAFATSGAVGAAYHLLQQEPMPPELGVTPELFDWGLGSVGWAVGFIFSTLILGLGIWLAINFGRWLIGLRDWS